MKHLWAKLQAPMYSSKQHISLQQYTRSEAPTAPKIYLILRMIQLFNFSITI